MRLGLCREKSFCSRDAEWERENYFGNIFVRPKTCSAPVCQCPNGKDYNGGALKGKWVLEMCDTCGSIASHKPCAETEDFGRVTEKKGETGWTCDGCYETLPEDQKEPKRKRKTRNSVAGME